MARSADQFEFHVREVHQFQACLAVLFNWADVLPTLMGFFAFFFQVGLLASSLLMTALLAIPSTRTVWWNTPIVMANRTRWRTFA
jgi:hypothetical protein